MAGQKGRDVLIRISDGAEPESFNTDGWRELLAGAGLRWVRVRGRGLFKDAASDERMRAVFMGGELCRFRLTVPGLGELTGPFQISQLGWGGTHDGEATFSIDLQSAGAISFEAAS